MSLKNEVAGTAAKETIEKFKLFTIGNRKRADRFILTHVVNLNPAEIQRVRGMVNEIKKTRDQEKIRELNKKVKIFIHQSGFSSESKKILRSTVSKKTYRALLAILDLLEMDLKKEIEDEKTTIKYLNLEYESYILLIKQQNRSCYEYQIDKSPKLNRQRERKFNENRGNKIKVYKRKCIKISKEIEMYERRVN